MSTTFLAILFSSFVPFHSASKIFKPSETDNSSILHPFVEKWVRTGHTRSLTVVFDDYDQTEYINMGIPRTILETFNVSTKSITLTHLLSLKYEHLDRDYESFDPDTCILILYTDIDHLREIFSSPVLVSFWNPGNLYLLFDSSKRSSDWFELERFFQWGFEKLWRFRRVFKVIVFTDGKTIRHNLIEYAGYHRNLFYNNDCDWYCIKQNRDSILVVNETNNTDVSDFFETISDFKLYPMKISIFKTSTMQLRDGKYSGIDFNYLREITRKLNVTTFLLKSKERYGWSESGAFYGTIGDLVYQYADVSFNQFFMKDYMTRQVEVTTSITSDKLCVLVPKAPPIPDHLIMIRIFTKETWAAVFASYLVVTVVSMMFKNESNREILNDISRCEKECSCMAIMKKAKALQCFFRMEGRTARNMKTEKEKCDERMERTNLSNIRRKWKWKDNNFKITFWELLYQLSMMDKYLIQIYLELLLPSETKREWFPERLLLMSSMLMTIILSGVFTSQLASNLSKQLYYSNIDTLEELDKSGLPILTNSRDVLDDVLTANKSPLLERLRKKLQYANDSESEERLFLSKNAAVLHRLSTIPFKYDEQQISTLHVLKECPKDYIIGTLMTKGSPFRERINTILGRLNNGGFYDKWYRDMFQSWKRTFETDDTTEHRKITIQHLLIPFLILQAGLVTSTVVFIRECRQNNPR